MNACIRSLFFAKQKQKIFAAYVQDRQDEAPALKVMSDRNLIHLTLPDAIASNAGVSRLIFIGTADYDISKFHQVNIQHFHRAERLPTQRSNQHIYKECKQWKKNSQQSTSAGAAAAKTRNKISARSEALPGGFTIRYAR